MSELKQSCRNCEYYALKYQECEHPDQSQREADYKEPTDGSNCELWELGGEPNE